MRALLSLFLFLVATPALNATWSIIVVNTRTGEIAIASATCVQNWDLRVLTAVVVVGKGAAAAQSYVDFSGANRILIYDGLTQGIAPADMLAALALRDAGHQTRQYGMVDIRGRAVGFTGTMAGAWSGHLTGRIGDLAYAIQGNVLTGKPVITAAEAAIRATPGDLASKLMAAMEAARRMGGDGRCSCAQSNPTGCGAPPANFRKSAHIGFMIIARPGDPLGGPCTANTGCARGTYYMNLNVIGNNNSVDPVIQLRQLYDTWRTSWRGRPDHFLSSLSIPSNGLPADGKTSTEATLVLRDHTGARLNRGGATIKVTLDGHSARSLRAGPVRDNGDGSYTIPLTAGATPGLATVAITADNVHLAPHRIPVRTESLWVTPDRISIGAGGTLDFVLHHGPRRAGVPYLLLASNSGTRPGITAGNLHIPLNPDPVFWAVFQASGTAALPGFLGALDNTGHRRIRLALPRGSFQLPAHTSLHFAAGLLSANMPAISPPVEVVLGR